jgi:hypothetical protein
MHTYSGSYGDVIVETPRFRISWWAVQPPVLLIEQLDALDTLLAVEIIGIVNTIFRENADRIVDCLVSIPVDARVDLENIGMFDMLRAVRVPEANSGLVVFCGRYYMLQAIFASLADLHDIPLFREFRYAESLEEAATLIAQAQRSRSSHAPT